ncbi:hypothetical protein E1A91_D10G256800v1 [Gossypium mustelinum]|uniref:Uncharacterized protein n=1 Tax=Gossypium mustelinum TaxID=34275 RepID=A0A5D2TCH3_GOSMU|nr:hypothetical protein E1A91_D10G256800v1 [Gossypium mustelinum]
MPEFGNGEEGLRRRKYDAQGVGDGTVAVAVAAGDATGVRRGSEAGPGKNWLLHLASIILSACLYSMGIAIGYLVLSIPPNFWH